MSDTIITVDNQQIAVQLVGGVSLSVLKAAVDTKAPKFVQTANLAIVAGVVSIDVSAVSAYYVLPLTADVTSWALSNLPPAGSYRDLQVRLIQNATSAKAVANPATGSSSWVVSSVLSSEEILGLRIFADGTVEVYPTGVGS